MIPSTTEASGRIIATPTERRSTFTRAAFSAEANGDRIAHGKPFMCGRGKSRVPITPEECLASFRAGEKPCVSEAHGRCSVGIIQDAKYPEDTTMSSKYGVCKECGRKGNLDSTGRCYRAECKAQRGKPKPGREKTPVTPGDAGETGAVSGQVEPFEKIEELAGASQTFQLSRALIASGAAMISPEEREHLAGKPAVEEELPEDLDRPFTVAGIEFEPARKLRVIGKPLVSIRAEHFSFLTGVVEQHRLRRFTHARLAASVDGQAVAIKFYDKPRQGAQRLTGKHGGLSLAAAAFLREHPGMRLRQGAMEETEWDGLFVVRLSEREAA